MQSIKKILKNILPPFLIKIFQWRSRRYGLFGNYASWETAQQYSSGYDDGQIITKVRDALLKVKRGEAVYERDSVLFDKIQYSWPLVAGLLKAGLASGGRLHVLDFGGSLGTTYFQNKLFLEDFKDLKWGIVEQNNFVKVGQEIFADEILSFYRNLEECQRAIQPNVVVLSGVIQYIAQPFALLDQLLALNADYLIIDRLPLSQATDRITVQKVDPRIYPASYPAWLLNADKLISYLTQEYELLADFTANDGAWQLGKISLNHQGYILRRKKID